MHLTQGLFFLLNRFKQQEGLAQPGLFQQQVVSDYFFAKDKIFASLTLSRDERALYNQVFALLEERIPKPDLVFHLTAPTEMLLSRIDSAGTGLSGNSGHRAARALPTAPAYP